VKRLGNRIFIASCAAALIVSGAATATSGELEINFADAAWNGETIPAGQQCKKDGGKGSTPGLQISGLPEGTVKILMAIRDKDARYQPMRTNGGHGIIGFEHAGGDKAMLVAVPGGTKKGLPPGTWIERKNKAGGAWSSAGYLPPCSGGAGNMYLAELSAVDSRGKKLSQATLELGKY
jgi:hypothetical protein